MTADHAHDASRTPRGSLPWAVLAVGALAILAVVDGVTAEHVILTTTFVLVPLALALVGPPREVAVVAALAIVLALLSGVWNDFFLSTDHCIRILVVTVGSVLAVLGARARGEAEEGRERMETLASLGRIATARTLDDALSLVGDVVVPRLADLAWVDLVDGGPERLMTRASGRDARVSEGWLSERSLPNGEASRRAVESGSSVLLDDVTPDALTQLAGDDPADVRRLRTLDLRSCAIVPLTVSGRVIGAIGFATVAGPRRSYDRDDLAFFGVLGGRLALALSNARLLSELSRTRQRLDRILDSMAEAVTVHDATGQTVYANQAAVRLLGAGSVDEVLSAAPGALSARFIITHEDGSPVEIDEFPGRRLVAGAEDPAPLLTRSVHRATGREHWILTKATLVRDDDGSPLAVNVLEDVTEAKDAELRQRFLDAAGQVLASSLDYETALGRVAALAVPWLADWCAVDVVDDAGRLTRIATEHADPAKRRLAAELMERYPPGPEEGQGVGEVVRSGKPELYERITDEMLEAGARDAEHLAVLREIGMRSAMVVPMRAGGETYGAMTFVSAESARSFAEDDFAFAQDLARRAATAVQNGRLYAEQRRVAQTLQRSLLPDRLPRIAGWQLGASYVAGADGAEVGGDFYDVVPADRGHLVVLGDVTGKGVEAAALTALVRHSARTAARLHLRPAAVLELVDGVLREQPDLAPVSMVCALIERRDGGGAQVTIASGGHPLPILKRPGEPPLQVGEHDMLLGVAAGGRWTEHELEVLRGDALLFYTDGVIDAPGGGSRFGEHRLAEVVSGAPSAPVALIEAIESALREFHVAPGGDDRAMLALYYAGPQGGEASGGSLERAA